ncbi:hypothetical protein DENSPDRAFT_444600 [Dentipellis sp. KUC8613]|nr:hypothetical protein DENSPDRAFT_444600 [Dentipellis sp. KUC8613]
MFFDVDAAFTQGKLMARSLKIAIEDLRHVRESRKMTWNYKIRQILKQEPPTIKVGMYGTTGAGKSSLINAILDGTLMTTSSYGAGTATVTEVAYHADASIRAEVKFVSEESWRATISTLLAAVEDSDSDDPPRPEDERRNVAWSQRVPDPDLVPTVEHGPRRYHLVGSRGAKAFGNYENDRFPKLQSIRA